MAVDIIEELKRQNISAEYVSADDTIKFIKNDKSVIISVDKLERLFLQTLIQKIDFQINLLD